MANDNYTACIERQTLFPHASGGEQAVSAVIKKFPSLLLSILNHISEILNTKSHLSTTISRAIFLGVWLCQRR
jgi:hypothetical protein